MKENNINLNRFSCSTKIKIMNLQQITQKFKYQITILIQKKMDY